MSDRPTFEERHPGPQQLPPDSEKKEPEEKTWRAPIEIAHDYSRELRGFITWNREHQDPEEKKAFVYLQEMTGSSSDFSRMYGPELHESAVALQDMIGTKVQRKVGEKVLDYVVIPGDKIKEHFPDVWEIAKTFQPLAEELWGGPLVPLHDKAAVNINIVPPGGEQGRHMDRNEVTFLIYVNGTRGGELEIDSQTAAGPRRILIQKDTIVGLVKANEIPHEVLPVEDMKRAWGNERVTLVVSFGLPGKNYEEAARDDFLYDGEKEVPDQKVF